MVCTLSLSKILLGGKLQSPLQCEDVIYGMGAPVRTIEAKETYYRGKRELYRGKRDLL